MNRTMTGIDVEREFPFRSKLSIGSDSRYLVGGEDNEFTEVVNETYICDMVTGQDSRIETDATQQYLHVRPNGSEDKQGYGIVLIVGKQDDGSTQFRAAIQEPRNETYVCSVLAQGTSFEDAVITQIGGPQTPFFVERENDYRTVTGVDREEYRSRVRDHFAELQGMVGKKLSDNSTRISELMQSYAVRMRWIE